MFRLIYLRVPTEAAHGHVLGLLNKFEPNNENFGKRQLTNRFFSDVELQNEMSPVVGKLK